MRRKQILETIEANKAVAIVRVADAELFEPIARAMYEGGIKVMEITMTVPGALSLIKKAVSTAPPDLIVGVGSVIDAETVKRTVDAGAAFVVSPVVKEEIIQAANDLDVPVMPGAFTPTEIQLAWEAGADVVKVFPAGVLGMGFIKAVKAPLPHLKLMPTGGVSLTNANQWIDAGACAVGVGSSLLDKQALKEKNFDKIRQNAEMLLENLN